MRNLDSAYLGRSLLASVDDDGHIVDGIQYNGSDGVERELYRGSSSKPVTFESRVQFCEEVLNARFTEFDKQISAI